MDIVMLKALMPVSGVLQSSDDRRKSTASGSADPAAVSAVVESGERDLQRQLAAVASQLQDFLNSSQREVEFSVDADTNVQVLTVRDSVTGQVIRQFPNEDVIRVIRNLTAQQGTLLNELA
jgi:flagellar protein FlaG